MSDPVTNVEIEDVLSSIRRLVSDGEKAHTRDFTTDSAPTPEGEPAQQATQDPAPESGPAATESNQDRPERLVLTPAFLVVDGDEANDAPDGSQSGATPLELTGAILAEADDDMADVDVADSTDEADDAELEVGDLSAADTLEDAPLQDHTATDAPVAQDAPAETTDRSKLVATIAELEAAVSSDFEDYEPDGSEAMGETIMWPGATARRSHGVEDAQAVDPDSDYSDMGSDMQTDIGDVPGEPIAFEHRMDETQAPQNSSQTDTPNDAQDDGQGPASADVYADDDLDDDLDDLLDVDGAQLDEVALRALVSEVVREELAGPMGERITRNVRKLVRREIYRILSSQEFD